MRYVCFECNLNCEIDREGLIELGLDPDSEDKYDRLCHCQEMGTAIFEKVDE